MAKRNRPTQSELNPVRGGTGVIQDVAKPCTRKEALCEGYVLYWNGKPCKNGHVAPRYTKTGHCKRCYQLFRGEEIDQCQICKDPLPK